MFKEFFKWFFPCLASFLFTNEATAQSLVGNKFICQSCDIQNLEKSVLEKYGYKLYYDINEFDGFNFSINIESTIKIRIY